MKGLEKPGFVGEASLSAEDIRERARGHKERWRKFLRHVELRTRAGSREKIPSRKKGYLVFLFEKVELDLLLDLDDGEIYEIVDGRFKSFLMDHHRVHPEVRRLFMPADDSLVLEFSSYTHRLDPKYIKDLFWKNGETAFIERDEVGAVRHYYYDLTKRADNPDMVIGVVVTCKDAPS